MGKKQYVFRYGSPKKPDALRIKNNQNRRKSIREAIKQQQLAVGGPAYVTMGSNYLHSSVKGFSEDYAYLTKTFNYYNIINDLCDDVAAENEALIAKIKTVSDKALSDKVFGKGSEDPHNLKQSELGQFIFSFSRLPAELSDAKQIARHSFQKVLCRTIQDMKPGTPWKDTNNYNVAYDIFKLGLTNLCNLVSGGQAQVDSYEQDLKFVQQFMKSTPVQNIDYKEFNKLFAGNTKLGQSLGRLYESALTVLINMYVNGAAKVNDKIHNSKEIVNLINAKSTGVKGNTSDILIENPLAPLDGLQAGISVKMKLDNKFSIQTESQDYNWTQAFPDQLFDGLAYLYQNILALNVFTSRDDVDTRAEDNLNKLLYKIQRYINLKLLRIAFFGNKNDVGVSVFSPEYYGKALDKTSGSIPAFLITNQDIYTTYLVFQYYNNELRAGMNISDDRDYKRIFNYSTEALDYQSLSTLYDNKRRLLVNSKKATGNSIYGILSSNKDSMYKGTKGLEQFSITATDIINELGKRSVSMTFALKSSSAYTE